MNRVRLLVFNPVLSVLDYRLPEGMATEFGSLVIAPLGPRQVLGIVWEKERLAGDEVPDAKLRPLLEVLPVPPLSAALRRLIEWTADYYVAPMNAVARMALGSTAALRGGGTTTEYRLSGHEPKRLTPQRLAAIDALHGEQASIRELAELASVSDGVLRGLVSAGVLEPVTVDLDRPYPRARANHGRAHRFIHLWCDPWGNNAHLLRERHDSPGRGAGQRCHGRHVQLDHGPDAECHYRRYHAGLIYA